MVAALLGADALWNACAATGVVAAALGGAPGTQPRLVDLAPTPRLSDDALAGRLYTVAEPVHAGTYDGGGGD